MKNMTQADWIRIFNEYNAALTEAFNRNMAALSGEGDPASDEYETGLDASAHNDVQSWFDEGTAGEDRGGTAIDAVADMADALAIAVCAAGICDDGLPDRIKVMLGRFMPQGADTLVQLILDHDWSGTSAAGPDLPDCRAEMPDARDRYETQTLASDEDVAVSVLLRLLGEWKIAAGLNAILDQFTAAEDADEMFADACRAYLVALGEAAVAPIIAMIGQEDRKGRRLSGPGEYLLIALTDIGKDIPSEDIYRCLKNSFLTMENQVIGAICLGDYGDGRAVAFLRGWVLKHPEMDDVGILSDIYSSIKLLGGNLDDLPRMKKPALG